MDFTSASNLPFELRTINEAPVDVSTRRRRFYAVMEPYKAVEFIGGKIIKQLPVTWRHAEVSQSLFTALSVHVHRRKLGEVFFGSMLITLTDNDYEPDVSFFGPAKVATFTPETLHFPAPDLVVEVLAADTEQFDRGVKKQDYAAHGVAEYWIVDPARQTIEQHQLDGGAYRLLGTWKGDDPLVSFTVRDFHIPAKAAFDTESNLAALNAQRH